MVEDGKNALCNLTSPRQAKILFSIFMLSFCFYANPVDHWLLVPVWATWIQFMYDTWIKTIVSEWGQDPTPPCSHHKKELENDIFVVK